MESRSASSGSEKQQPKAIVCICARPDEPFYHELQTYLFLWQRQGYITWLEIQPGAEIRQTISIHLQKADLILLLMSPDFFADDYCYIAMSDALHEQTERQVRVVPVLVRDCGWKESACGKLRALPDNEQPIARWMHSEQAYKNICAGLARLILPPSVQAALLPKRPRLFQARDLPKGYVPRPKVFDAIKRSLLNQRGRQTMAITTALRGTGGFGKTTLALALCHDSEIQEAFSDGILWIELGEQPPRSLDLLNGLLASLAPELEMAITLEEARDRWHKALHDHTYLFVIDDVWQEIALEPLLEGGLQCVRLVTTRNDQVLPEEAERINVDAMDREEAIAVFCKDLPNEIEQEVYRSAVEALVMRLNCWPLLLTLARGMMLSQLRHGRAIGPALQVIERAYEMRGVIAFDLSNENERRRAAGACLETSLRHLEEFTSVRYHPVKLYQELAIFPENIDIPLITLQRFWKGTGGLEPLETEDLCRRLDDLSLLTCDLRTDVIRLHNVMYAYLQHKVAKEELRAFHEQLLNTYGCQRWAELPQDEPYLWKHLAEHLINASRSDELVATVKDGGYLAAKTHVCSVYATETDIDKAIKQASVDSSLLFLKRNVARISHLLNRCKNLQEGASIFHSRFSPLSELSKICIDLEEVLTRPFLTSWHPFADLSHMALMRTLEGHKDWVRGCAVDPMGDFIVSASFDKTLKVWNAQTGVALYTLEGHTKEVNGCAVDPMGDFIVSASSDETLKVWNAEIGTELYILQGDISAIYGCAISPKGDFIVSASSDETLKIWDAKTRTQLHILAGHADVVNGCAVSPDGDWIVSASSDETLKVWDAHTGKEQCTLKGHTQGVYGCAFSPNGKWIVSASSDGTLKVWDAQIGIELRTLRGHTDGVYGCAISPDGKWIISASYDKTLKVWDTHTGDDVRTLPGHSDAVYSCAVSPDGDWIVSASYDNTLKIWNMQAEVESLITTGYGDTVNDCAVSPSGDYIVSALVDETLVVWDAQKGVERLNLIGHTRWVNSCAVSPDGSWIVSASSDETLKMWNAETGEQLLNLNGHIGSRVNGCAISPDGSWIVSASDDQTLKQWNAKTGQELRTLKGHINWVSGCRVSPDGTWLVSASWDKTLKMWNAETGEQLFTLNSHTGKVNGCAISPNGSWIVSASDDQTLKQWNAKTGQELRTLRGHTGRVNGCAISPDGSWIVSASSDETLKVWDARTGDYCTTLHIGSKLQTCAFFPDGRYLVAGGDGGVYFLKLMQ